MNNTAEDLQLLHQHLRAAAKLARLLGEAEALLSIELTIELLPDEVTAEPELQDEPRLRSA